MSWTEQLLSGQSTLAEVVGGFVGSREFQNTYGALDNRSFVTLLYENVLERAPDAPGLSNWIKSLESSSSREDVVLGFSESNEFKNTSQSSVNEFIYRENASDWSDDVFRLYQATLDRSPDLNGFVDWTAQLGNGRDLLEVAGGFVGSREFQNTYGSLDNTSFVELLYLNVLGRNADAAGQADWLQRISDGASRSEIVVGFSQSREFAIQMSEPLKNWIRSHGHDDTLEGDGGTNTLSGGMLSDVFVFEWGSTGNHVVVDFEPWDYLNFTSGFYYSDAAEVLQHFEQVGQDAVFSDRETTVTILNTNLASLTEDAILI